MDSKSGDGIAGAEFTLSNADGTVIQTSISDQQGFLAFRNLTEGIYTLTETKVPAGYTDCKTSLTVTIKQHPVTMEYELIFSGSSTGAGTGADPLRIENYSGYELPNTGGDGTSQYIMGGILLVTGAASLLLYLHVRRKKEDFTSF